jgi:putative oxidoreductase
MNDYLQNTFQKIQPYAAIFLRIAFGYHLMQYTQEDILQGKAGENYGPYLQTLHVPFPVLFAWLVLGIEFFGGFALIIGYKVRWIAIPLIIIFINALILVHWELPYLKSFEAIQILAVSFFFLFHGAGKFSIDNGV